jgi:hypothetical protein
VAGDPLPRFIPADDPATYMRGGLLLAAPFVYPTKVTCAACKATQLRLKLLSHSALNNATCNRLLTAHLDTLGWSRLREGGADICPECTNTARDVCPYCRDYTGGHARTCITQLPGGLTR